MRFNIPPPLDRQAAQPIQILAIDPIPRGGVDGSVCRSYFERGDVATDLVVAISPRWIAWAVEEAMRGRLPRTKAYVVPALSGASGIDLGRGPLRIPMAFGGATCSPHDDGQMCDHPDPAALPEHASLVPRRPVVVEDAGDVVFDDMEDGVGWPAIVVDWGTA